MKKISIFLVIVLGICLTSCFTDKSSLDTEKIPAIVIDTTGISGDISVARYSILKLSPAVTKESKEPANASYLWRVYPEQNSEEYIVIGRKRVLDTIINLPIRAGAYMLQLTVSDNTNDLKYSVIWNLYVSSTFKDGLIVSDTRDNSTSDMSLIMDQGVTEGFSGEAKIHRDIYSQANGKKVNGLIKNMLYSIHGSFISSSYERIIWACTDNSIMKMSSIDFSLLGGNKELFIVPFASISPKAFYPSSQQTLMVEGEKIYAMMRQNDKIWGYPIQNIELQSTDYRVGQFIATNSREYGIPPIYVWYDATNGKFWKFNGLYSYPKFNSFEEGYITSQPFNPSNLPGMTCKGAGLGDGSTFCFLLKNSSTSNYGIYVIAPSVPEDWNTTPSEYMPSKAKAIFNISSEYTAKLDQAISTFFCPDQNIMYFATTTEIYAVNFNTSNPSVTSKYQAPSGEIITVAKLFQQGTYKIDPSRFERDSYGNILINPMATNNRQLIVATYKSTTSEGFVRTIPMTDIGTGNLDVTKGKTYSGFGKITEVSTQGI